MENTQVATPVEPSVPTKPQKKQTKTNKRKRKRIREPYLAFDIETTKVLPDHVEDLRAFYPLGISCAGLLQSDSETKADVWFGMDDAGRPLPQMSQSDAAELVDYLLSKVREGYTIITWNGLGFDFDVLAHESRRFEDSKKLALGHGDLMFHFHCENGFPVSLDKVAHGMGLPGKTSGLSGSAIPTLWQQGQHQLVAEYVAQDVKTVLDVCRACDHARSIQWITQQGSLGEKPLYRGWYNGACKVFCVTLSRHVIC